MNKKEMAEAISERTCMMTKDSKEALNAFLDVVSEQFKNMKEESESDSDTTMGE